MNRGWWKFSEPPPCIIPQGEGKKAKLETLFRKTIELHGGASLLKLHQVVIWTLVRTIETWQDVECGGLDFKVVVTRWEYYARRITHNLR
jgi:hypothetical protein